jgi:feruloyl esterase
MRSRLLTAASMRGVALGFAGAIGVAQCAFAGTPPTPCTVLNGHQLTLDGVAQTLLLQAQDVPAGYINQNPPSPAACLINAVVSSNGNPAQSQIVISVWLPETGWNGRFLGTGNGGFAGTISTGELAIGLLEGYATANTDMGTGRLFNCNSLFCGSKEGVTYYPNQVPGGLFGDAAALEDFGYGATHLMTLAGKELIQDYYGTAAAHSYFHGCSTGGQEALMEAQRYPTDYNGILAGSPAYNRTHLHIAGASGYQITHFGAVDNFGLPDSYLTNEALELTHLAMLSQCAGKDGGVSTDDYLTRPAICGFHAASLQCTGAQGEVPCDDPNGSLCSCLTPDQATAMDSEWKGALDDSGRVLYPGYERGVEEPANNLGIPTQESLQEPAFDSLDYWAFGANFDWTTLFSTTTAPAGIKATAIRALDKTVVQGTETFADALNANNANLSAFNAAGGKLIMYAGYEDPLIPSASSIDYYNQALKDDPNTPNYAKLFMAPGMWHCNGGPGANAFGNFSANLPPIPTAPFDDIMADLTVWVELGGAPQEIVATHYVNDQQSQGIESQRLLCPYPKYARYKILNKKADPKLYTSYVCQPAGLVTNQLFSPVYGPH